MRMAARSPAAIAAIRASSDIAHTKPPLLADLGTGEPVVCIVIGLPRAAASHLGWEFSHWLFHLIYVARWKWFRAPGVLFRVPCRNETMGRFGERIVTWSSAVAGMEPPATIAGSLRLLAQWGEQIAAPSHGADDAGVGRVGLDLAPDAHDPDVDSPIEGLGVACIGEFEQAFAGEDPFRVFGKCFQQAIFRRGQRMLVALLVAKRAPVHIEPFGAETNEIPGRRCSRRDWRGGTAQH